MPGNFSPAQIDYSWIGDIGDSVAGGLSRRWQKDASQRALEAAKRPDGTYDWGQVTTNLLAAGDYKGATISAQQAESETQAKYRQDSLVPDSVREYEWFQKNGMTGDAPAAPGAQSASQAAPGSVDPNRPKSYAEYKAMKEGGTAAQKAVDTNFAKDYSDWVAEGGSSVVEKSLDQLYSATGKLGQRDDISGSFIGNLPNLGGVGEIARSVMFPESIQTQQDVEEPIQTNLRRVLGSQYTQQEGENLLRRTYDPRLSEGVNAQRVIRVIGQLKTMSRAKEAAARYYEANGTLRGFTGKLPSLEDVRGLGAEEQPAPTGPQGVEARPGAGAAMVPGASPTTVSTEGRWPETGPVPPPDVLELLRANAGDPEFRDTFERQFGAGSVDRWLGNDGWTGR
jgi:hypothetical protein